MKIYIEEKMQDGVNPKFWVDQKELLYMMRRYRDYSRGVLEKRTENLETNLFCDYFIVVDCTNSAVWCYHVWLG